MEKQIVLTGLDERNRLECADMGMLGFQFQYNHSQCVRYAHLCRYPYPWTPGNNDTYGDVCFYRTNTVSDRARC